MLGLRCFGLQGPDEGGHAGVSAAVAVAVVPGVRCHHHGDHRASPPQGGHPMSHGPNRPSWRCRDDGDLWQCELACKQLREAYPDDEIALATHMAWLMA